MASPAVGRNQLLRRRSTRITLNTPVGISGEDRAKTSFSVSAKATNLNRHGAAVLLSRELLVGSTVLVRNKGGTQISARIVAQISAVQGGVHSYGIEFVEEDTNKLNAFWGIVFPATT
jgi:PilZ domain-containing protein